ncbi:MAG TPA: hypothetical protein EYP87_03310 [Flavobacteriaceae bacterium]|nr:hypothetical protein [Flavobacteriaceae bacterium]
MFKKFISLEWKQFKRSSYWQKSAVLNILLVIFALYFILSFLILGFAAFPMLKEQFPEKDPLKIVNGFLLFWLLFDLVFRYLMQKIPALKSKPLLSLPIKKKTITHYVLGKSIFSFFNIAPMFFVIPFGIMLYINDYSAVTAITWILTLLFLTLTLNFINFLVNKNNKVFIIIASLLVLLLSLNHFKIVDFNAVSASIFNSIVANPLYLIGPFALLISTYYLNFKDLLSKLFVDGAVSKNIKDISTSDLSWTNRFGEMSTFLKNDMRLIWRNKRPRTVFLMSFIFLFYGLIFVTNDVYNDKEAMLVFVAIFITGMFTMNFGQFIPAWDSSYYSMLMSQNIKYRKYLDSKWFLMTVMTSGLFLLSLPYAYFGFKIISLIFVGAIFNIGFTSLFILFAGAYNRKRIDLDRSAFANYQGTSATQFLMIIPIMLFPMIIFGLTDYFFGFYAGASAIFSIGLIGIIFKNSLMNKIEKLYIKNKYKTVSAFEEKA